MILIALASWKPAHLQPITSIDRYLEQVGDQTKLLQVLHQAEQVSRP